MRRFDMKRLYSAKRAEHGIVAYEYRRIGQGVVFDNQHVAVSIGDTEAAFESLDQAIEILGIAVKFIDASDGHEYNAALGEIG